MSKTAAVNRRKFLMLGTAAGVGTLLPIQERALAVEAVSPGGTHTLPSPSSLVSSFGIPPRPVEKPLLWQPMADAFEQCVMNRSNGVLRSRPDGTIFFTSALEATEDGGMTTFAPLLLGKILQAKNVSAVLPSLASYFNQKAGIYLDGHNATLCEYWYLMNINAMAAAITRRSLKADPAAIGRVRSSADRLIELAHQISYNFNDQGYKFDQRVPFTNQDRFRQPDTVGGYAYVMLMAYEMFQDRKYLEEATTGIRHYLAFARNPWYEIPSGAMACLAAARLSLVDSSVDAQRALAFAFDAARGPMQLGSWNGREVNGLMQGFHSEPPEEAYSMESMVVLPYLLPMVRYRPEFAAVIGRYALNVSANLRWFFPEYLPANQQSRPELTSAVPYERIDRKHADLSPYASGDYKSHRSIYGGAYIMWWGALVRPTNDNYILQLDISSSDFLSASSYPTYLYYNPYQQKKSVSVSLPVPGGRADVYDLSSRRRLHSNGHGSLSFELAPDSTKTLVVLPVGAKPERKNGALVVGGVPIDYRPGI